MNEEHRISGKQGRTALSFLVMTDYSFRAQSSQCTVADFTIISATWEGTRRKETDRVSAIFVSRKLLYNVQSRSIVMQLMARWLSLRFLFVRWLPTNLRTWDCKLHRLLGSRCVLVHTHRPLAAFVRTTNRLPPLRVIRRRSLIMILDLRVIFELQTLPHLPQDLHRLSRWQWSNFVAR